MISVSRGAMELVLRDIQAGVEYPDFWTNRYSEDDEETETAANSETMQDENTEAAQA